MEKNKMTKRLRKKTREARLVRHAIPASVRALIFRTYRGHIMGLPALLLLFCGLRLGELFALMWSDINLEERTLTIRCQKSCTLRQVRQRIIPIPNLIIEALKEAREKTLPSNMVMLNSVKEFISRSSFYRSWTSYLTYLSNQAKHAGLDVDVSGLTASALRHSYACMLVEAGVDITSASKILGYVSKDMI